MNRTRARLQVLCLLALAAVLSGCPPWIIPTPQLQVSPVAVNFGEQSELKTFTIMNTGTGTLEWTAEEVVLEDDGQGGEAWVGQDIPWLTAAPLEGSLTSGLAQVELTASRAGLASGTISGVGVRVTNEADGTTAVVRISITVPSAVVVSPQDITLSVDDTATTFTLRNTDNISHVWQIEYLEDPEDTGSATVVPDWLTVTPSSGTIQPTAQVTVHVAWQAMDPPVDFALLVTVDDEQAVVQVTFGEVPLVVTPSPVVLYGLDGTGALTLQNTGTAEVAWRITSRNQEAPSDPVPFTFTPETGTTAIGESTDVAITVTENDPSNVTFGEGPYVLLVRSGDVTLTVPVRIEDLALPEIVLSQPPDTQNAFPPPVPIGELDFGNDAYQGLFYIANQGPTGSTLYFVITHEDEDVLAPVIESILVDGVPTDRGSTDKDEDVFYLLAGADTDANRWIYGAPISVIINRNNLQQAVEYRTITITAWDSTFGRPLDGVDPVELKVRVERPPIQFEGTRHRSRPPFMLRFVFLLRDSLGEAIDTRNEAVFAELNGGFTVYEDDKPLTDETNYFVTHAENLRYDVAVLLDYSRSMQEKVRATGAYPGSPDPLRELYSGAIGNDDSEGLIGTFLRDLPASYQTALMEFHDRQQGSRLLHRFATDDDTLIRALKNFTLPEGAHGVSELYDGLADTCELLAAKDAGAEPFITDADVRAIVFVTDGKDTSSSAKPSQVIARAQELGIRLYPVAFGEDVDAGTLIGMAEETGGHFYQAKTISGEGRATLDALFVNDPALSSSSAPGRIAYELDRQIVLTYVSPIAAASSGHTYRIRVDYAGESGETANSVNADDNLMSSGDVHAGQVSLATAGIFERPAAGGATETAVEVYVRAEYVPRNLSGYRFRFTTFPAMTLTTDDIELTGLLLNADGTTSWRVISEGSNIFRLVTGEDNYLPYGSFGNLLKLTFANVPEGFQVGIRADSGIYGPPSNIFVQYPLDNLIAGNMPDVVAVPLADIALIEDQIDPSALDSDGDGTRDFDDPEPLNANVPLYFVRPMPVVFTPVQQQAPVDLFNGRLDDIEWQISDASPGLSFNATIGATQTLDVGDAYRLNVSLDRSGYGPGTYERTFTLLLTNAVGLSTERIVVPVHFLVNPTLEVDPEALTFPMWVESADFVVDNIGTEDFNWQIAVLDPNQANIEVHPAFLTFSVPSAGDPLRPSGTTPAGGLSPVTVTLDRDHPDLTPGTHSYTFVISAATAGSVNPPVPSVSRGSVSVPVEIQVLESPSIRIQHDGQNVDLVRGLWMLTGEETLELTFINDGTQALTWSLALLYMDDPSIAPEGLPITLSPNEGAILSGERVPVTVSVDQRALYDVLHEGNHEFRLSVTLATGVLDIPLTINLEPLPIIETVKPPDTDMIDPPVEYLTTLDFGKDEYQMVFHVANVGHQDSELHFKIEYADQNSTTPLIADVKPLQGTPETDPNAFRFNLDGQVVATLPISVTIDRNNIQGAVDERMLTIVPMDSTFTRELASVERKEITVRVERPPLQIEGAQNRSRPPFMLRFVFLLRDGLGNAIDTLDPAIFAELQDSFKVYEDGLQLPADETNHFVTYASDLRYDLVLLLDYTGSMFEAARAEFPGLADPLQELYAGPAGDNADEGAVGALLRDLPDSYNVALMEYHDRQQGDRLIHGFDTDDDALIESLKQFYVPAGSHGASQIYDALADACDRLAEKDAGSLPLVEDADVRAVVFISEGWDTSSATSLSSLISMAQDLRVRMYPIGFGDDINYAGLIQLAEETGGHFYRAPKLVDPVSQDLLDLLAEDTLSGVENAPGRVTSELARQIVLTYITLLPGGHSYQVQINYQGEIGNFDRNGVLDNFALDGDVRAGQISLSTNGIVNGSAEVDVRAEYIPRNVSQFRFRLVPSDGTILTTDNVELLGLLSDDGIPPDDWRVIDEGNNVFSIITDELNYLRYGSFGDLLRIRFDNVAEPFTLGIRVDNSVYFNPPFTTYFQYPLTDLDVAVGEPDVSAVALEDIYLVQDAFDPDAVDAFDADGDGTRDFDDPEPQDAAYPPPFAALPVAPGDPLPPPGPARIDFGSSDTTASLQLTNQRFEDLTWRVSNDLTWLDVAAAEGSLAVGAQDTVVLTVDRNGLAPGRHEDMFTFELRTQGGGSVERIPVYVTISVPAAIVVEPDRIVFPGAVSDAELVIGNTGSADFDWTIEAVNPSDPSQTVALPAPLSIAPGMTASLAGGEETALTISADRNGLALGVYNYMLRISTSPDAGAQLVPVELVVAGTPNLEVDEGNEIWMMTGVETASLTLRNTGDDTLNWRIAMLHAPEIGISLPVEMMPIQVAPAEGAIPAAEFGAEPQPVTVTITVDQPLLLELLGEGRHRFQILIAWDRATYDAWFFIDLRPMPEIELDREGLDFGRDPNTLELAFQIGNPGALNSKLNYAFEVLGEDNANTPLVTGIRNDEESPEGLLWRTDPDSFPVHSIRIRIDRTVLNEQVEYRTIRAYDTEIPAVAPKELRIRVEQTPLTVEGAINRSRPPYVMRFVFLLRDMLGQVIPTRTPEDLAKLDFVIEEDGVALDRDETNQFTDGPESLKYNIVLLLDYTGSMYNAGLADPRNPLDQGEAIAQMVEGAKGFVDDLPEGYRVAVMEYHDRQQGNRVLHNFTTDKASLKDAISSFSLPPGEHGASEVLDALSEATSLLVAEDPPETVPFDDADVRAVVFVSDGWDTSSISTMSDVLGTATESRVRFYPIGFSGGQTVNNGLLVDLATGTGGHVYYAPSAESLVTLLANEMGFAIDRDGAAINGLEATFDICAVGGESLPWMLDYESGSWLSVDQPYLGSLIPGQCDTIHLVADDTGLAPGVYSKDVTISAETTVLRGGATQPVTLEAGATVELTVPSAGSSVLSLHLTDEPGRVWRELQNQVVLTYISLFQGGSHSYEVQAKYTNEGNEFLGSFQENAVYFGGDVREGQVSLYTTGITLNVDTGHYQATAFVRADYVPRNISQFRFRFYVTSVPPDGATPAELADILAALPDINAATVGLVPDGLIEDWRLIPQGDGVYTILTEESNALLYGAAGNLLRVTFANLDALVTAFDGLNTDASFSLGFRVDNALYFSPAVPPSSPSTTKYFAYPGGHLNRGRGLIVGMDSDTATPARNPLDLTVIGFDPEDPLAWDNDEDGVSDFDDPAPDDELVPAPFLSVRTLSIGSTANSGTFTIRNARFDTFTWTATAVPAWATSPLLNQSGTLAPGESTDIVVNVDRTGLVRGVTTGVIEVETDFEVRELTVNLSVP